MSIQIRGTSGTNANTTTSGELLTAARLTDINNGGLPVRFGSETPTTATINGGAAGIIVGPVDVSNAGNVTFIIANADPNVPYDGRPYIVFEQSSDAVTWAALPVMRSDTNVVKADRLLEPGVAGVQLMFDGETEGANWVRVRVVSGPATKALTITVQPGVFPFTPAVAVVTPARTSVLVSAVNHAVGASGVENPLTLTQVRGGVAFITGTSFVSATAGRTFRTQSITLSQVGNSTNNAASTVFRLRFNVTGPATVTSPAVLSCRIATISEPGDYEAISLPFPDGFDVAGDGVAQFMWTVQSTYGGAAPPTVDFLQVGYEF